MLIHVLVAKLISIMFYKMSGFNLRKRARVCYYEPEEPAFDEYVFCTECRDYVYEYCAIHGPLLVIPDDKVGACTGFPAFVPRAALTIPRVFLHLARSRIPEAGLGVFSTLTLPSGVRFGPYRGRRVQDPGDSCYGWQIYDRNHKPLHIVDARDANNSNWMRYVNCSRHHAEQNLVAYQYQGELYYRTVKVVPRFAELLVFYGSEFAASLGVELRGYRKPCPCDRCQAQLTKKSESTKPNKRQTRIEKNKEKPITENIAKEITVEKLQEPPKHSQIESPTNTDIQQGPPEKPASIAIATRYTNTNVGTNFKCNDCGKGFNVKTDLEKHIHAHFVSKDTSKDFKCNTCGSTFNTKLLLLEHEKSRHGVKYFACKECDFVAKHASSLRIHLRTHNGERPYKCSQCGVSFTQKAHLLAHQRIHTGGRPYTCSQCNASYTRKGSLLRHQIIHNGKKPYRCNQCGVSFTQKSTLQDHQRIHTGDKPFECNICDYKSAQSSTLKSHLMSRHSGQKPYACDACIYRGATRSNLTKHMKSHHKAA